MPLHGNDATRARNRRKRNAKLAEYEIFPIPAIQNLARRIRCEADPVLWLQTYLPEVFFCEFSESQKNFVTQCWDAILMRGYKNINAYRGFGKTSILAGLLLMSHLTGHTKHAIYITAEGRTTTKAASEFFQAALYEDYNRPIEDAKPLAQDYPEVLYPIQRRGGIAQRPLRYNGEPVGITIGPEEIVFPTIKGSISNGAIIRFTSIGSSSIRGAHKSIRGEGEKRVDVVFLDDVQSDGTAKSDIEVSNIMATIKSTVKFLSGRTKRGGKESLIILSALTQNQSDDVAVRILNEMPEFCSSVIRFLPTVPNDFRAWGEYRDYYADTFRKFANKNICRRKLKDYYLAHRSELEEDVTADNDQLFEDGQVSAIQYALEVWCGDVKSFWCELQNDSIRAAQETDGGLSPIVVLRKVRFNNESQEFQRYLKRCWIPRQADVLTAFIDCGEHYLNYQTTAFSRDFSMAHVVDFGVWPDQRVSKVSKKTFVVDLQSAYKKGDKFDRLKDALVACLSHIFTQQYFDHEGRPVEVNQETRFLQHAAAPGTSRNYFRYLSLCGVDAGDGEMETSVWRAVSEFHRLNDGLFLGRAIPTYGHAPESRLMRFWPLRSGEYRRGKDQSGTCDWVENPERSRGLKRRYPDVFASLIYDSNTAKTRRNAAWMTPIDRPGAESHFESADVEFLKMFSEHQCAETYDTCYKSNVLYQKWRDKKPHISDNEFLDTDAGCWALASYVGCEPSVVPRQQNRRPKMTREEAFAAAERRLNG